MRIADCSVNCGINCENCGMWVAPPTQLTSLKYCYRIRIHFSRYANLCKIFPTPAYSLFAPARTICFPIVTYIIS